MYKKILLLCTLLLPVAAAAQDEIRTAAGDTVMRKVLKIERKEFFTPHPNLILEKTGSNVSTQKVPYSYMKSIRFQDGCEVFFDENGLVFDKTKNPRLITADHGSLYLEGLYKMTPSEIQALVGEETYKKQFQPYRKFYSIGEIATYGGVALCLPWVGANVLGSIISGDEKSKYGFLNDGRSTINALAITGVVCIIAGTTMCIIGRNGCKRFAHSFSNGELHLNGNGLTYRF